MTVRFSLKGKEKSLIWQRNEKGKLYNNDKLLWEVETCNLWQNLTVFIIKLS